jgi:putative sugar O-methyltransferase
MKNLFNQIRKLISEKRFIKTIKKKLYPYIKGFVLLILFRKNNFKIFIPKNNIVDKKDLPLAEKIFESYKIMKSEQKNAPAAYKPSSLWQSHIDKDFYFLKDSYENNDIEKFLFFLQNFGNWDKYLGIENQLLIKKFSKNIFLNKFLSEEIFNGQLKLWKYFNKGSKKFKNLNMPRFGNQNGAYIDNNFVVIGSFFNEIYSNIIKKYLNNNKHNIVVDLGGGYGRLGYYILKDLDKFTFIDFDIPETLTLASYYLSKSFPEKRIFYYGQQKFEEKLLKEYDLFLLPSWEIEKIKDDSIELTINKNSLGEMEPETAYNYIDQISRISKYFFSINHETFRNKFDNNKFSLINSEYNKKGKFKELLRYPDIGHLTYENNKIDLDSDIFFYIFKKN